MSANNNTFKLRELELDLDFGDYTVLARIDKAMETVKLGLPADAKNMKAHEQLKLLVDIIAQAFCIVADDANAGNKALGGTTSYTEALEAFQQLIEYTQERQNAANAQWESIANKYAPNRAARRANKVQ